MKNITYAVALKNLINYTKTNSTQLALHLGYDISYISKWKSGAKLPSAGTISEINNKLGAYFAIKITEQNLKENMTSIFPFSSDDHSLPAEISQYLCIAYKNVRNTQYTNTPDDATFVRHLITPQEIDHLLTEIFQKNMFLNSTEQEIIIYGDFCALHDVGFWSYFEKPAQEKKHIHIKVGINYDKLESDWHYVKALYDTLNLYLTFDFTLYDYRSIMDINMIVINKKIILQYSLFPDHGISSCVYINDLSTVKPLLGRLQRNNRRTPPALDTVVSPWEKDPGYRTYFYDTDHFFFYLTNGIEYLLPSEVFDHLLQQAPSNEIMAIERLRITWEEILNKAHLNLLIPLNSLIRYLETGTIDLTRY